MINLIPGVELCLLEGRHAAELFAVIERERAHVSRYDQWPRLVVDERFALGMIEKHRANHAAGLSQFLGVFVDGAVAGMCGIREVDTLHGVSEVSYWLAERHTGRGIISTGVATVGDYWFRERGMLKLEIRCNEANKRSVAVARRLGFTQEGVMRGSVLDPDRLPTALLFGLLREEWDAMSGGMCGLLAAR